MNLTKGYLSASQIKMWMKCSMQYFLKYTEGVKEHEEKSEVMELGSAIHLALEEEFNGKNKFQVFTTYAIEKNIPDSIVTGLEILREAKGINSNTHSVEEAVWIVIDRLTHRASLSTKEYVAGCDEIKLNGYIDRIDITKDEVEIADYKTGKFEYCREPMKENLQLGIYAIYASLKYPNKKIRTTIERLSLDFNDKISDIYEDKDIQRTIEKIIKIVDKMEASEPVIDESGKACKWCRVKSACPKFQNANAEEERILAFVNHMVD